MPWSEKYRPATLQDLVITDDLYTKIYSWLERWMQGTPQKKALVLHGLPGTGKSTSAYCIAKSFELPVIEMNSSSQRNAEKIREIAGNAAVSRDLFHDYSSAKDRPDKVILVDEADNIYEGRNGPDSGGIRELAGIIRDSRNPIILTMNDYYTFRRKNGADAVLSLSESIEFKQYARRNDNNAKSFRLKLLKRVRDVLALEGKKLSAERLNDIFERNQTDIRAIFNDVEAAASVTDGTLSGGRDEPSNIFRVLEAILYHRDPEMSFRLLSDKDFTVDLLLLWMDQNLVEAVRDESDLDSAYNNLALADLYDRYVIKKQHYAFQGYSQEIAALTGAAIQSSDKHYIKFQFPSYLSRMSSHRDAREQRKSILLKLSRYNHASTELIASELWFFRNLARHHGSIFSTIAEALNLSEAEAAVLTGRNH